MMATRKEIYTQLEGIEGGEAIRDALKELFQSDDKKLQEQVDAQSTLKKELEGYTSTIEELKKASEGAVPKTEMEKQISEMQKSLETIMAERDEAQQKAQQAEQEKKTNALKDYFSKPVADAFGAKNTEMAVGYGISSGAIKYDDDGNMIYNDKTGDEAIEAFRADNSHLIQNKGHGTTGGDITPPKDDLFSKLEAAMLKDD